MDTKLKNNKKTLNKRIFTLILCAVVFTSSLFNMFKIASLKDNYGRELSYDIGSVDSWVKDLMQYTNDFSNKLKEDSIQNEVNYIKTQIQAENNGEGRGIVESKYLDKTDEEIRGMVIYDYTSYVNQIILNIKSKPNIEFYYDIEDANSIYTNTNCSSKEEFEKEALENSKEYILVKEGRNIVVSDNLETKEYLSAAVGDEPKDGVYIRLVNPLEYGDGIRAATEAYEKNRVLGYIYLGLSILSFTIFIYMVIKLVKNRKLEVKKTLLGKAYIEIRAVIVVIAICYIYSIFRYEYRFEKYNLILWIVILLVTYVVIIDVIKLLEKYNKGVLYNEINNTSIIFKFKNYVIKNFIGYLKETKLVKSTLGKVIIVMCIFTTLMIVLGLALINSLYLYDGYVVLVGIIILTIIIFGNIYILKIGSALNKIVLASKKISEGNYDEKLEIKSPIILNEIADNIENIQSGLKDAVNKAVKSEKMKGELITNVSHDLKTPLTSIINYVDLLEQENITEGEKEKYIKVLKEKSNRLKVLIEDLFEVSKASSGNMELNMDNIDVVSLLTQTLVELDDKIEASGLKFIKSFPKEKVVIYADGRKLFRVFQNLLSNIFKYSMKNSRVYIEVKDNINYVEVIFRNISEYELNFTEEEILQRFKRGDESRTTEGSGLGLSIAKSLVELQKGKFDIHIDGDLFKVTVKLVKDIKLNEEVIE